jgi:EAL domain-containing protein (putative c-di-GMP-specific phosphodiesterase class I)
VAVDDTGAGYASLRHILTLCPDIIKLDISLVRDIHLDPARRALAASLVTFARETHSELIAEGIETADELRAITALDVRWGQGYHLGRPAALTAEASLQFAT